MRVHLCLCVHSNVRVHMCVHLYMCVYVHTYAIVCAINHFNCGVIVVRCITQVFILATDSLVEQ